MPVKPNSAATSETTRNISVHFRSDMVLRPCSVMDQAVRYRFGSELSQSAGVDKSTRRVTTGPNGEDGRS